MIHTQRLHEKERVCSRRVFLSLSPSLSAVALLCVAALQLLALLPLLLLPLLVLPPCFGSGLYSWNQTEDRCGEHVYVIRGHPRRQAKSCCRTLNCHISQA